MTYPHNYSPADPDTSRLAGEAIEASGKAAAHRDRIAAHLLFNRDRTSAEIARDLGMDRHAVARRMSELVRAGRARESEQRLCSVCRTQCVTYWPPVQAGQEVMW